MGGPPMHGHSPPAPRVGVSKAARQAHNPCWILESFPVASPSMQLTRQNNQARPTTSVCQQSDTIATQPEQSTHNQGQSPSFLVHQILSDILCVPAGIERRPTACRFSSGSKTDHSLRVNPIPQSSLGNRSRHWKHRYLSLAAMGICSSACCGGTIVYLS